MTDQAKTTLLALSQRLLDSIAAADWQTYQELCDPSLTAFEPEARGHLIEGMRFHEFYFNQESSPKSQLNATISSPQVRMLGDDAAVVSYIRLIQRKSGDGGWETLSFEETRIWQRQGENWRHVHFHRSANP